MTNWWQDVKIAARTMVNNPQYTLVAVLTFALAIGANTLLFAVVNAVLLRDLPFEDPQRLVVIWSDNRPRQTSRDLISYPNFFDVTESSTSLQESAGVSTPWNFVVQTPRGAERVPGFYASTNLFGILGTMMERGRAFRSDDARRSVAIVSHRFWVNELSATEDISGLKLDVGHPHEVVGVLPPGFRLFQDADIWLPLETSHMIQRDRGSGFLSILARLKPEVSLTAAAAELTQLASRLEERHPESNSGIGLSTVPLLDQVVGDVRNALLFLLSAVGCVLLIACLNVATLSLNRYFSRRGEIGVRLALGAGPIRIFRQVITESVALALVGSGIGLLASIWLIDLLPLLAPSDLPRIGELSLDSRVVLFTVLAAAAAGTIAGLAPAWRVSRLSLNQALQDNRSTENQQGMVLRRTLAVAEVGLTLMLLVGAGLMVRSFLVVTSQDPGFESSGVLTLQISSELGDPSRRVRFYQELFDRLEQLPQVLSAGGASRIPMRDGSSTKMEVFGRPTPEGQRPEIEIRLASQTYFKTLAIPLKKGRIFNASDHLNSPLVAVVNETAARSFWANGNPLEQRIRLAGRDDWITIVGVVGDIRHYGLELPPRPEVYMSFDQRPPFGPLLVVRASVPPNQIVPAVRSIIREADPTLPVFNMAPMDELVAGSVATRRFQTQFLGLFSLMALTLAGVGIFGIVSFLVNQRLREIGIRFTLGARRNDIFRMVLGEGFRLLWQGLAVGLIAALILASLLSAFLYRVAPWDPVILLSVSLLLAVVVLVGSALPARRATRVSPVEALRSE